MTTLHIPHSAVTPIISALEDYESITRCPHCRDLVFCKEQCAANSLALVFCPRRQNHSPAIIAGAFGRDWHASLNLGLTGIGLSLGLAMSLTAAGRV